MFAWWREADIPARRAFVAAALGWMLDSFDVMLYALVLAALIQDPALQLSTAVAGQLGAATLLAAAAGGVAFGVIADRIGRKRALMAAVLIYSIFTAACGLAQTVAQLAVFRILLGFGMGGEWATGVALVSETFPARHRGKALGSSRAPGRSATASPPGQWSSCRGGDGAPCFSSACCRRSSRSGSAGFVGEPEAWRRDVAGRERGAASTAHFTRGIGPALRPPSPR